MIPETINKNENGFFHHEKPGSNDVKKIVSKLLMNWYWFIFAIAITVALSFFYIRYTPPEYEIQSTLLLGEKNSTSPLNVLYGTGNNMLQETRRDLSGIYNQMAILSSSPIVSKALSELNFEVSYYSMGRISETELYKNVPFVILWDENHPQIVDCNFYLSVLSGDSISVSIQGENIPVHDYKTGQGTKTIPQYSYTIKSEAKTRLETEDFSFIVILNDNMHNFATKDFMFRFHTHNSLIEDYQSRLKIDLLNDYSTILALSFLSHNITKGIDFLSTLIQVYQNDNLNKKNQNANLTIQFIDSQLQNISDSLTISESKLESFRRANQMINFSAQSQQLLSQLNELDNKLIQHQTQNKYYKYLKNYIEDNQNLETVIAPSAVGIEDPLLNNFIIQLNELINEKTSQTSIRPGSEHPAFVQLNTQIEIVKNSLRQSINNIIIQSDIELENLYKRLETLNEQIRRLPATERNFVNFERRYKIDSETYTFLLQKLSEARIAQASNIPDGQMLESPDMKKRIRPQTNRVYALSVLLGLIFPSSFIVLGTWLNNKILSQEDLKSLTNYPIIGHVVKDDRKPASSTPMLDYPNSPIGNSFASIRAKINLMTKAKEHSAISVTSALPNEGKTFNAINIATSIALTHKTAVLLDLDVRNSKIAEIFNFEPNIGVVNYIIGQASLEEITFNTKLPKLKIIPAGLIPPNPAEMLSDEKLTELVELLKNKYDVVIIDTPPIAFISDIFQLNDRIDANIFVVRHNYTPKEAIKMALEDVKNQQMKGVGIIINLIRRSKQKRGAGKYGYGYGYGYGYVYGNGKNKRKTNHKRKTLEVQEIN